MVLMLATHDQVIDFAFDAFFIAFARTKEG
jgi:hypothetical protein